MNKCINLIILRFPLVLLRSPVSVDGGRELKNQPEIGFTCLFSTDMWLMLVDKHQLPD